MAKKKLDFTGVESFVKCEEGQHVVKLIEIEEGETQDGDDKLSGKFEVTKGSSKGAIVYETFVLTEKGLWKLKGFLNAIGVKADGKIVIDFDKLVGKTCIVEIVHEKYNGKNKAKIEEYKKLAKIADEDEDDDEDDDEEEEAPPAKTKKKSAPPAKKKAKPPVEEDEEEDEEDEEEDEEPEPPKKKSKKAPPPPPASKKKAKKPVDDEDEDEDWDEA